MSDWLDILGALTVGAIAMATPWLIWAVFYGLYEFYKFVGVM